MRTRITAAPEDAHAAEERERNDARLIAKIRPLPRATYSCEYGWNYLETALASFAKDWGGCNLDPDYQRGHVWSREQQICFVENVLRGTAPMQTLIWNNPYWDHEPTTDLPREMQLVDGKQRLTAVREFLRGAFPVFGDETRESLAGSSFDIRRQNWRFQIAVFTLTSRRDLLQFYLDLNAGGTVHAPEEIARVRALRDEAPLLPARKAPRP